MLQHAAIGQIRRDPGCPEGVIADQRQASIFCIAQVLGIIKAQRLCKSLDFCTTRSVGSKLALLTLHLVCNFA